MSDFSDSDLEDNSDDLAFNTASEHLQRTHASHTPNDLLELYALYKQATVGICNTTKPGIFNMQARAKWSAWHDLGNMSSAEAKRLYVEKLAQLDPQWQPAKQAKTKATTNWVVHSVQLPPSAAEQPTLEEHEKTCFDYAKEGNLTCLRAKFSCAQLQELDCCGLGLLHWATDRNAVDVLDFLLKQGANVNLQDAEGQTALHYAASCAHVDCLKLLLNSGADRLLRDASGQTCLDVADDAKVREILER